MNGCVVGHQGAPAARKRLACHLSVHHIHGNMQPLRSRKGDSPFLSHLRKALRSYKYIGARQDKYIILSQPASVETSSNEDKPITCGRGRPSTDSASALRPCYTYIARRAAPVSPVTPRAMLFPFSRMQLVRSAGHAATGTIAEMCAPRRLPMSRGRLNLERAY